MTIKRIHITGNAGSGKSTLAKALAEKTKLPFFGLDKIVWQPGWEKTPLDIRRAKEIELIQKPAWIIEGVSGPVREAADLVIFLDVPRMACAWRCLKRSFRYRLASRPELPPGCPELLVIPQLAKIIWRFPELVGRNIIKESRDLQYKKNYIRLRSNLEVLHYLDTYEKHDTKAQNTVDLHVA